MENFIIYLIHWVLALQYAIWTSMNRQRLSLDSYNELAWTGNDLAWIDKKLSWIDNGPALPKMISK